MREADPNGKNQTIDRYSTLWKALDAGGGSGNIGGCASFTVSAFASDDDAEDTLTTSTSWLASCEDGDEEIGSCPNCTS